MRKYESYKDSNIEWLDTIPSHWNIAMFKNISYMKGRIGWQGLKHSEFLDDKSLPYLITGMNFKNGIINWNEVYHISLDRYNEAPEIQLREQDILMTKDGTIGKLLFVDYLPGLASMNSHLLVFRPLKKSYLPKFTYYQLQSGNFFGHVENYKYGTTFYGLSQESMGKFICLLPPLKEQQSIANYLDAKTSAMDKKVTLLEQKIETYKKLKRTLINQTITKGLDKNVPLKDSGISWIGHIPKHWEVKRLKDIFSTFSGGTPSTKVREYWNGNIPWIPSGKVQNNIILKEVVEDFISEDALKESSTKMAKSGSILIALTGATCSNIGLLTFDTTINQSIVALNKKTDLEKKYFFYYLVSASSKIRSSMTGGAQAGINQEDVKFLNILHPPKSEQEEIANYLDNKTATIDAIVGNITKQIETLKQLRKTLINDVVTGKIKVVE